MDMRNENRMRSETIANSKGTRFDFEGAYRGSVATPAATMNRIGFVAPVGYTGFK